MGRVLSLLVVLASMLAVSVGCGGPAAREDVGVAVIALSQVPSDVACVRVTVSAARTVQGTFDVTPGRTAAFTLAGLPLGNDTFSAEAFGAACVAVAPDTVATWVGDSVTARVTAGEVAKVSLTLHRNGRAVVSVGFDDGPEAGATRANGAACAAPADCSSGFCVDGVCCDSACSGACVSCGGAGATGTAGHCTNVAAGTSDPHGVCTSQEPSTCGTSGLCNGSGACALQPGGTACSPAVCQGNAVVLGGACDGAGTCVQGPQMPCAPFACNSGRCNTTCATNNDCTPPFACNRGVCGAKPLGAVCGAAGECASGFCADGFCCNTACNGLCVSCGLSATAGTCTAVAAGTDPKNQCVNQGPQACQTDGFCDGLGACRLYQAGTVCRAPACLGGTLDGGALCNGAGTCIVRPSQVCSPFACIVDQISARCLTSCNSDGDCAAGTFCATPSCVPLLPQGSGCSANAHCASGTCIFGVCL